MRYHRLFALLGALPLAAQIPEGFRPIFNGKDLAGWHRSEVNHHGNTSGWTVENGVLTGTQDKPGHGGILLTDRKYRDFEVYLEINPDFGCDSGLFLRANEKGQAYQVMLDYLEGGNVGGIYGERLEGVQGVKADFEKVWKKGGWNSLRARIEGPVPHITVWINGTQLVDWTDTANHAADGAAEGMIAVQVHRGNRWVPGGKHRFRNIAVRELNVRGAVDPAKVAAHYDIEYGRGGARPLQLDLYVPKQGAGPFPVVVWVHGGGWRNGSKDRTPALRLVDQGYAVASVGYRLSGVARFPAQIEDVKAAVRWLRANAAPYKLRADRMAAWGASAGGHLVALLGTSGGVKELEGSGGNPDQSSRVQAVVDFFGPTDFLEISKFPSKIDHEAPDSPEALLLGGPIRQRPELVRMANPIAYASKDDPPFLILHGDQDPLVPLNQSELLVAALEKVKVPVKLHVIQGAGHGFSGPEIDRLVDEFLARQLKR